VNRISWEEYALALAKAASKRSEDPFVKVGAVVLRSDRSVAGVGYNGAPAGIEIDWSDRDERRKRVIHAEINALRYVRPNEADILACTLLPCSACVQTIAAHGIKHIIYNDVYAVDDLALTLCKEFNIKLEQF
jgi:dCMP deaminase|tara:strand:- start:99 stop:497 length:399 start_codon:yes stop_codon:yes gene_type:complete